MKTSQFEALIQFAVNRPKTSLILSLGLAIFLMAGMANLSISNDFRVYFSSDNPHLKAFEAFEDDYVKSDNATLVISARQGDLFTRAGLQLIEQVTEEAWQVDYAYRVSSLSNYIYTEAQGDEIKSDYLVSQAEDLTESQVELIKQRALQENRLVKSLLAADGKMTVVFITVNLPTDIANPSLSVTQAIEALAAKYQAIYPQYLIETGGSTTFNTTLARAVEQDLKTLLPLSYVVIFIGLLIFLRSLMATVAIFVLVTLCLLATFGFYGWVAPVLTPIAGFAPSILLSIMVADSVHILTGFFHYAREGHSKNQAILQSLRLNFMPVLMTSVTTMIGFLSLNFSTSPPYQSLGNMVAFGVLLALLFSLGLLPALMQLLPLKGGEKLRSTNQLIGFADWLLEHKKKLIAAMSLLALALIGFIPNNRIADNWANYFDETFPVVRLVNKIDGYLTGVNSLEYSLKPAPGFTIFSHDYLTELDAFEQWFESQAKVVKVSSFAELMKDLNQTMNNDDPRFYILPESSDLAAQYLLFYEFGLPDSLGINDLVTIHKDASRFRVSISKTGSDEILALDEKAQEWLAVHSRAIVPSQATGLGVVFAHIAQTNINSLLQGTLVALLGISLILTYVLKSLRYGLISLIPNLIPAAMAYGFWGMSVGYIDISLSIVACATLGIVVDDTIHFLHKYQLARQTGLSAADSIRTTFNRVGLALLTTSAVLSVGFLVLAFSHMNTSATIGFLMAVTLLFALAADFLLLPPLLYLLDKDHQEAGTEQSTPAKQKHLY